MIRRNRGNIKPGTRVAFRDRDDPPINRSAEVVEAWPRFPSGDYLVTLRLDKPFRSGKEVVTHLEVFASEIQHIAPSRQIPLDSRRKWWPYPGQERPRDD